VIFVDTSAWFAAAVPTDPNYPSASAFLAQAAAAELVTTDYILDETLTLLAMRGEKRRTHELGRRVLEESLCRLVWVQREDVHKAWLIFDSQRHQGWSFTDCVSYVVIERLQIDQAFAFDAHFRQFGDLTVVP
jgi:predicted nucleic acid-binding protein